MNSHALIANIDISSLALPPEYKGWLKEWLRKQDELIENEDLASSVCFQAVVSEVLLFGKPQRDWDGVFALYLTDQNGKPLAYSEKFGRRLYGFNSQWKQTPVHAVYTRYWFDTLLGSSANIQNYADLIESFIQPNGWIYNPLVSPTQLRTRMKSELFMSTAMGVEILNASGRLENHKTTFVATLAQAPITGYISAEYFRLLALETLRAVKQKPIGLTSMLNDCKAGQGYCDFAVKNKVDDYMGTAKRTSRDIALHSPLSTVQAIYLSGHLSDEEKVAIETTARQLAKHLEKEPFDIPAFTIRDIPVPFGTDISPVELVCAAWLRQHYLKATNQ